MLSAWVSYDAHFLRELQRLAELLAADGRLRLFGLEVRCHQKERVEARPVLAVDQPHLLQQRPASVSARAPPSGGGRDRTAMRRSRPIALFSGSLLTETTWRVRFATNMLVKYAAVGLLSW